MWIERPERKGKFIHDLLSLKKQVMVLTGARQVGKTSFVLNAFSGLSEYRQVRLNLLYPNSFTLSGVDYLGRDFFGKSPSGEDFLKNLQVMFGDISKLSKPVLIFIDEVDRYPIVLEAVQTMAEFSEHLKIVLTGSNLENIPMENAATGRKNYFDLYPITFREFLGAGGNKDVLSYFDQLSFNKTGQSDFYHNKLKDAFNVYLRIGGMPVLLEAYLSNDLSAIPQIVKDLVFTIEENVKTVLGEKIKLYEYEDVLRTLAHLSMNTLKFSRLQVQHAGRSEAKKLVSKTVGARVAHKIRLLDKESDLSKYIIFDCGIVNYLLNGSDLLKSSANEQNTAVMLETFAGTEIIAGLVSRDDLFYWKSENRAELEYVLKSPLLAGVDVKTKKGDNKSLNSFAIFESSAKLLVKICDDQPSIDEAYQAGLPNYGEKRKISFVTIPHYLCGRLVKLIS